MENDYPLFSPHEDDIQVEDMNYNIFDDYQPYTTVTQRDPSPSTATSSSESSSSSSSDDEDARLARGGISANTEFCYIKIYHNFWKWLYEKHPNMVTIMPLPRMPASFEEMKAYPQLPIDMDKLTPQIFLEYAGSRCLIRYRCVINKIRQPFRRLADFFDKQGSFNKLFSRIDEFKRAMGTKQHVLLPPSLTAIPPPAKRKCVIKDDDKAKASEVKPKTTEIKGLPLRPSPSVEKLLLVKHLMRKQWEILESLTPGLIYPNSIPKN